MSYNAGTRTVTLEYDTDVDPDTRLPTSAWKWRDSGGTYNASTVSSPASNVISFVHGAFPSGPSGAEAAIYTSPPGVLTGANGVPVPSGTYPLL